MNQELPDTAPETSSARPKVKLWTPMLVVILVGLFSAFLVCQGMNTGSTIFVDEMGGSSAYAGLLAAAFSFAAVVSRIACGPIVDAYGRQGVMIVGAVVLVGGTVAVALSGYSPWLPLWRVIQGVGFAAVTTAAQTAAADIVPASRFGEGIGYAGLGQALAMAVGPAMAIGLITADPPTALFWALALVALLSLGAALAMNYERRPEKLPLTCAYRRRWERRRGRELQEQAVASEDGCIPAETGGRGGSSEASTSSSGALSASDPTEPQWETQGFWRRIFEFRALPGALVMFIGGSALGFAVYFVGVYGTHIGVLMPGMFFTFTAISMIVVRLKSGAFMDTMPALQVYGVTTLIGVFSFALLLVAGASVNEPIATALYWIAGIAYGIYIGVSVPLNQTVSVKCSPPARWGAATALYQVGVDAGIGVSVVLWGVLNDGFGYSASLIGVIILLAVSFVVAVLLYPSEEKKRASRTTE